MSKPTIRKQQDMRDMQDTLRKFETELNDYPLVGFKYRAIEFRAEPGYYSIRVEASFQPNTIVKGKPASKFEMAATFYGGLSIYMKDKPDSDFSMRIEDSPNIMEMTATINIPTYSLDLDKL